MTKDEALKLGIESLEWHNQHMHRRISEQAIAAMKEALAQPEQESVKYDCCGNCMRPQHEHNGNSCPKPYTTVWHAWDYGFSPYPAPAVNPSQQAIHCKHRRENSGVCPHHNLQCGWPKCNEPEQEPVAYIRVSKTGNVMACAKTGDFYKLPDKTLLYTAPPPCPTCEALARTVMMDQTGRDA